MNVVVIVGDVVNDDVARPRADPEVPTGNIVVPVEHEGGERSMFTDRGANLRLDDGDLPRDPDDVAHLHVSGYPLFEPTSRRAVADLIVKAVRQGLPVSTDPSSASYLREMGPELFVSVTAGVGRSSRTRRRCAS